MNSHLPEQLQEVIHISGAHGLSRIPLVLKVVLAGVGGVNPETTQRAGHTGVVALECQLGERERGEVRD